MTTGLCESFIECFIKMDHLTDINFVCGLADWLLAPIFYHILTAERQKNSETAIGASLESFHYDILHSLDRKDENINLAAPLMASYTDVSSEQHIQKKLVKQWLKFPRNLRNLTLLLKRNS